MSKLNIGLESLMNKQNQDVVEDLTLDAMVDLAFEEMSIQDEMIALRSEMESYENLVSICDVLKAHGGYAGFEGLIAEHKTLSELLGVDICKASAEELACIYSNENIADAINKFGAKLSTALGRFGDRLGNFVKTTLPFKEKYLKEMTELKQILSGKKFDEEKLAGKKVASALSKERYNEFIKKHGELLQALHKAALESSPEKIDQMIQKMEGHPEVVRGWFATYVETPWKSWFTKGTVKDLGYTGKDVIPVIDAAIDAIKKIADLRTTYAKMCEQFNRLETQISQDRATGKVDDAIAKRKQVSNLQNFYFTMCEAAGVYDISTRRLMYFATYLGRAAKECMK